MTPYWFEKKSRTNMLWALEFILKQNLLSFLGYCYGRSFLNNLMEEVLNSSKIIVTVSEELPFSGSVRYVIHRQSDQLAIDRSFSFPQNLKFLTLCHSQHLRYQMDLWGETVYYRLQSGKEYISGSVIAIAGFQLLNLCTVW